MNNALLMVFIKNEMLGKVKTRLSASIGNENALDVYRLLLSHTLKISVPLRVDKVVYYSDYLPGNDIWKQNNFLQKVQEGADLGERMHHAFTEMFKNNYERIVIIGSDCYELTTEHLVQAFDLLKIKDAVIGPAQDGGYYLLGLKKAHASIFMNKTWSDAALFKETIETIEEIKISYGLLPALTDVDEVKDLPEEWKHFTKK